MELRLISTEDSNLGPRLTYMSDGDRYKVTKFVGYTKDPAHHKIAWIIITPQGDTPLHDWRDMQAIKNAICGPEAFAIEIYPPESDMVDMNNNYHLWVYLDGYELKFGFKYGRNIADPRLNGDRIQTATPQREFSAPPPGATNSLIAVQLCVAAPPPFLTEDDMAKIRVAEARKVKQKKKRKR